MNNTIKPEVTKTPRGLTRRGFVQTVAAGAAVGSTPRGFAMQSARQRGGGRMKIALLATVVRKYSHAQHFIDRFLEGYGWHGTHHRPAMDLVSLYVDQQPDGDLTPDRVRRHKQVKVYPTIAESLTRGGAKLDVDGVVIIAEHGDYPKNEKGQKRYPRYDFFKQTVKVFEDSGRAVPVFNDKHLSTEWNECVEMVEDSRRLEFAFLAGSSLPVTWRIPSIEMPLDTPLEESVCVCFGGVESYDIHGLETAQCMSERRRGGEAGVRSVHAVRGEKIWALLGDRPVTTRLVLAALARSHSVAAPAGYTFGVPSLALAREKCGDPVAYFIEHEDGFRTTLLMLNGFVRDFTYAGKVRDADRVISCQMYLPMPPAHTTLADFFNPLVNNIEQTFLAGKTTYPIERTLLTSGMVIFGVESLFRGQVPLLTPELKVPYRAEAASTYWRA